MAGIILPSQQRQSGGGGGREESGWDKIFKALQLGNQVFGTVVDYQALGQRRDLMEKQMLDKKIATQEARNFQTGQLAKQQEFQKQERIAKQTEAATQAKQQREFLAGQQKLKGEQALKLAAAKTDTKRPKTEEFKVAQFSKRVDNSSRTLDKLEASDEFDPTSLSAAIQGNEFFPEMLKSTEMKQYAQAQRNFINAVLRRESGANITADEFQSATLQYFASPGDSPDVLAQKRNNRITVSDALRSEGTRALAFLDAERGRVFNNQKPGQQQSNTGGLIDQAVASPNRNYSQMNDTQLNDLLKQSMGF